MVGDMHVLIRNENLEATTITSLETSKPTMHGQPRELHSKNAFCQPRGM
jgi:hypothetical protein